MLNAERGPRRPLLVLTLHLLLAPLLLGSDDCGGGEDPAPPTGGPLHWLDPLDGGEIRAKAGCSLNGSNKCRPNHTGIDIAVGIGSDVLAAGDGTVKVASYDSAVRGNYLEIEHIDQHGNVFVSSYWHLRGFAGWVAPNVQVFGGETVAFSGDSGNAAGHPHLHFGLTVNGQASNPLYYIPGARFTDVTDAACGERSCLSDCPCWSPSLPGCNSCVGGQPAPSPSGGGGLESMPLWLWREDAAGGRAPAGTSDGLPVPPLWKWATRPARRAPESAAAAAGYEIAMDDVLPPAPAGLTRSLTEPRDVIGASNALEARGADYLDAAGRRQAAIVAFRTVGAVYAHDYGICARFKAGRLVRVKPVPIAEEIGRATPVYFWGARMDMDELSREYATVFAVYVAADERSFAVDSHWVSGQYAPADSGYVLTFQVWSGDHRTSGELAYAIVQRLAARGPVVYRNTVAPSRPNTFVTNAVYRRDAAELTFRNLGTAPETLDVAAVAWRAPNPQSEARFTFQATVAPGTGVVRLPMPGILNAVMYLQDQAGFLDALYLADGHWYAFDDGATGGGSSVTLETQPCAAHGASAADRVLAGCAQIHGTVGPGGYLGMGRSLDPPGRAAVDASGHGALTFFARGDGRSYRAALETWSVLQAESFDFPQVTFTARPEWRQFVIPLAAFRQRGFDPTPEVAFTGSDVKGVTWSAVGKPLPSVRLEVDRVAFTNSTVISETARLLDTPRVRGPYVVTTRARDDEGLSAVDLLYSVDGGRSFARLPMSAGSGAFQAAIPGQPLETEVRYFVEATDGDGNVATDPSDAPYSTYRFQVSRRPFLWVDDFTDSDLVNLRGQETWLFRREPDGTVEESFVDGALRLAFDVRPAESFAGFVEPLGPANLGRYTTLTLRLRGGRGGERLKVGLRDAAGTEHKVMLGQYLADGVTTAWQTAQIPLAAFGTLEDWSAIDRLVVAFEQRIGSRRGSVELDDLRFEDLGLTVPVGIDNFDEPTGENGVGGWLSTSRGGSARITAGYDPANRYRGRAGYKIAYADVRGLAWVVAASELRDLDASRYQTLSLWIKGAAGGERPNLYLVSRAGGSERRAFVDLERYGRVTRSWKKISIPLAAFAGKGIDLSHLASLQLAFEGGAGTGTVYVDEIKLTRP